MIIWWSKHVGVIISVLMCDIWINVLLQTSALVGPLYIVNWNARWNSEIRKAYVPHIFVLHLEYLDWYCPVWWCMDECGWKTMWWVLAETRLDVEWSAEFHSCGLTWGWATLMTRMVQRPQELSWKNWDFFAVLLLVFVWKVIWVAGIYVKIFF
jgi:hypothetical protein